jgi:hypothetical protein
MRPSPCRVLPTRHLAPSRSVTSANFPVPAVLGLGSSGSPGARSGPELEDDVHGGLGDLPEPGETGFAGQLVYRYWASLGGCEGLAGTLRHKLGDRAGSLQTVRGAGYPFIAPS